MPSTNLQRTMGTATNAKKGTLSFWAKLAKSNNSNEYMRFIHIGGTSNDFGFYIIGDTLRWYLDAGVNGYGDAGGRLLRDYSAYYHIVVAIDSTLSTGADRIKCWVNGELQSSTEFPQGLNITQNDDVFDSSHVYSIGATDSSNLGQAFAGILSHYHFIDGTAYDASVFGKYDANGVWTIKLSPSVTYGNNGFFILKDGNSVTDQSGNGNNFTVAGGTLTNTEDSPSNVFATWNPLNQISSVSYSNGNNTFTNSSTGNRLAFPNLAMTSGKFYCEMKVVTLGANYTHIGLNDIGDYRLTNAYVNEPTNKKVSYLNDGRVFIHGGTLDSTGITYTTGDIIGMACDMDNGYLYYHKNGVYLNSGDPTSGGSGTGGFDIYNHGTIDYCFAVSNSDGGTDPVISANFGNGYFGTTAVSSAGTNASGIGIFEYDVPTGYTALSTKGLNL